jgi:hypothetical protein
LIEERSDADVSTTESNVKRKERRLRKGRPMKTPHLKLDLASCRFVLHDGRHRVVAGPIAGSLLAVLAAYALRGPGGDEPAVQAAQGRLEASPGPPATPAPTKNFGRFIRERPTLMVKMLPKRGPNLKPIGRLVNKPRSPSYARTAPTQSSVR